MFIQRLCHLSPRQRCTTKSTLLSPTQSFSRRLLANQKFSKIQHGDESKRLKIQPKLTGIDLGYRLREDLRSCYNLCPIGVHLFGDIDVDPHKELTLDQMAYITKSHGYEPVYQGMPYNIIHVDHKVTVQDMPDFEKIELRELSTGKASIDRNPAIVICGHVDHGKTSILDRIRNTDVQSTEHGGITQHVSAFTVNNEIVFLDTPGHAAFSDMRQRGVFNADIAILVIAADDGIMDQTEECLDFIKKKNIPFIVAINKIDKGNADGDQILEDLLLNWEIEVDEIGGDVPVVYTSTKKGKEQGIDALVEAIRNLRPTCNLKTDPNQAVEGFVVENHRSDKLGIAATCFVQAGQLRPGSLIKCGLTTCKVKSIIREDGHQLTKTEFIGPGEAARVLGWSSEPSLAHPMLAVKNNAELKEIEKQAKARELQRKQQFGDASIEDIVNQMKAQYLNDVLLKSMPAELRLKSDAAQQEWLKYNEPRIKRRRSYFKKAREIEALVEDKLDEMIELRSKEIFNIGIITDVSGTMEAIMEVLKTYDMEKPKMNLIFSNVASVTPLELDNLVSQTGSYLYTFHYKLPSEHRDYCDKHNIQISEHTVIYRLFDDIMEDLQSRMPKQYKKVEVGRAQIQAVFARQGRAPVLGLKLESGRISKTGGYKILDEFGDEIVKDDTIFSLRFKTDEVEEITSGECGVGIFKKTSGEKYRQFMDGDVSNGCTFLCEEFQFVQDRLKWSPHF